MEGMILHKARSCKDAEILNSISVQDERGLNI